MNGQSYQNILKEIEIHKQLDHANIIKFYKSLGDQNFYYFIIEYVPGGNLFTYIRKKKSIDIEEIKSFFLQILKAFRYLHSKGIVMRDLKPENILLSEDEKTIKLCDFGWASFIEDKEWLIKMAGTYAYMAPEALKSQMQGFETDVWALGILLFELFHGYEPYKGNDPKTVLRKIELLPIPFVDRRIPKIAQNLILDILKQEKFQRPNLNEIFNHEFLREKDFNFQDKKFVSLRDIQFQTKFGQIQSSLISQREVFVSNNSINSLQNLNDFQQKQPIVPQADVKVLDRTLKYQRRNQSEQRIVIIRHQEQNQQNQPQIQETKNQNFSTNFLPSRNQIKISSSFIEKKDNFSPIVYQTQYLTNSFQIQKETVQQQPQMIEQKTTLYNKPVSFNRYNSLDISKGRQLKNTIVEQLTELNNRKNSQIIQTRENSNTESIHNQKQKSSTFVDYFMNKLESHKESLKESILLDQQIRNVIQQPMNSQYDFYSQNIKEKDDKSQFQNYILSTQASSKKSSLNSKEQNKIDQLQKKKKPKKNKKNKKETLFEFNFEEKTKKLFQKNPKSKQKKNPLLKKILIPKNFNKTKNSLTERTNQVNLIQMQSTIRNVETPSQKFDKTHTNQLLSSSYRNMNFQNYYQDQGNINLYSNDSFGKQIKKNLEEKQIRQAKIQNMINLNDQKKIPVRYILDNNGKFQPSVNMKQNSSLEQNHQKIEMPKSIYEKKPAVSNYFSSNMYMNNQMNLYLISDMNTSKVIYRHQLKQFQLFLNFVNFNCKIF